MSFEQRIKTFFNDLPDEKKDDFMKIIIEVNKGYKILKKESDDRVLDEVQKTTLRLAPPQGTA